MIADTTGMEKIDDVRDKEERHAKNNAMWIATLKEEIDRLKSEIAWQGGSLAKSNETLNPSETLKPESRK
jgi:hypothetical protein